MKFKDFKNKLLKDPEFKKEYFKKDLKLAIAQMFIEARIAKGITQKKLAAMVGTKQPSIARIEGGNYIPGLRFLEKTADALDTYLIPPKFAFLEKQHTETFFQVFRIEDNRSPISEEIKYASMTGDSASLQLQISELK